MLENAVYSVISPRGFASILWKDASREQEAAQIMRITAEDLLELKVAEAIIPEPAGGAHNNVERMVENISDYLSKTIAKLSEEPIANLLENRYNKFRKIGEFTE